MTMDFKDEGFLNTYLGMDVNQRENAINIHQNKYCEEVIEHFKFTEAHACRIPMELKLDRKWRTRLAVNESRHQVMGCLYIWRLAQDPTSLTGLVSSADTYKTPTQQHIGAGNRVLRYKSLGIVYSASPETTVPANKLVLDGYYDFDWGNERDTRKSATMAGVPMTKHCFSIHR
ncbi:Hypothetical protein PHPALM_74 [Phytophthora palmivora]|uniref:Reverse transcriptase Ty1/copia-type domain-containing protein n=1 Tax=Phytophthora palmivora TaxID=4796 RepID=A0A2P4YVQ7_9STRA|nr:Hypothetical protein PHPALM_74 [Phytophthora palmivora]